MTRKDRNTALVFGACSMLGCFGAVMAWRVSVALSDDDVRMLVGGCVVLVVVLAVGAMFVAWSVSQSRLRRQELQQDDMDELKKMALILKFGGGRAPTVNVRTPGAAQLPAPVMWPYPPMPEQGQPETQGNEYRDSLLIE